MIFNSINLLQSRGSSQNSVTAVMERSASISTNSLRSGDKSALIQSSKRYMKGFNLARHTSGEEARDFAPGSTYGRRRPCFGPR